MAALIACCRSTGSPARSWPAAGDGHAADPAAQAELIKTWERLKKEFEDRQSYWEGIALDDPRLKQSLEKDSTTQAHEFFALGDKDYIPAVRAGDHAKLTALLTGKLRDAYGRHRTAIDDVVAAANKQSEIYARAASDTVEAGERRTWGVGFAILAICVAFWLDGLAQHQPRPSTATASSPAMP